ncbi:hypothetical protein PoB_002522900 [Plakobranchus ocellatus]|uniref:Uncharacterized protein n=1 Tax=Plakobranchus ocellatus TaxID=259542 RepID=A0AAV3ZXR2_9GAST|nr:hypothetical protein PoB_002522900 [Plakobranchus ocellatus]
MILLGLTSDRFAQRGHLEVSERGNNHLNDEPAQIKACVILAFSSFVRVLAHSKSDLRISGQGASGRARTRDRRADSSSTASLTSQPVVDAKK